MSQAISQATKKRVFMEALIAKEKKSGWVVVGNVWKVPEKCGHYAIYDGIEVRGCGVTWDMRQSIKNSYWLTGSKIPIFMFLPDHDGSAALWLDGKIRCKRCSGAIHEIGKHD